MNLLLDTHVWLWTVSTPERLSSAARRAIEDERNVRWVSVASMWEVSIKVGLGRLEIGSDVAASMDQMLRGLQAWELSIGRRHTVRLSQLPLHHRDPFDRMLIAQALEEEATLVTADAMVHKYDVSVLWAAD